MLRATTTIEGHVRFSVEDSGSGIPTEDHERIFDRFYRGDQSRSTGSAHAGLGLAIVKGILELHGSTVTVDSKSGSGSRFSFELPVHPVDAGNVAS
jgi:signal transduction histidine kinase